jgi:hypothetical protein
MPVEDHITNWITGDAPMAHMQMFGLRRQWRVADSQSRDRAFRGGGGMRRQLRAQRPA